MVVDGWLTIPLMKSVGYGARFSAAVEAATSTGGQIVPPVMGAGAFLMAEFINRPYVDIAVAAIIPSALYYISLYAMIDLEAIKRNLRGLPREQLPALGRVLINGWHLLMPIVILIGCPGLLGNVTHTGGTVGYRFWGDPELVAAQQRASGYGKGVTALEGSAKGVIEIAATCAAAGIVIGTLSMTGLGIKFATILLSYTGGNLLMALFFCMIVTLILGMGMPTTAAYVVAASVIAPGLEAMGAPKLCGSHVYLLLRLYLLVDAAGSTCCLCRRSHRQGGSIPGRDHFLPPGDRRFHHTLCLRLWPRAAHAGFPDHGGPEHGNGAGRSGGAGHGRSGLGHREDGPSRSGCWPEDVPCCSSTRLPSPIISVAAGLAVGVGWQLLHRRRAKVKGKPIGVVECRATGRELLPAGVERALGRIHGDVFNTALPMISGETGLLDSDLTEKEAVQ